MQQGRVGCGIIDERAQQQLGLREPMLRDHYTGAAALRGAVLRLERKTSIVAGKCFGEFARAMVEIAQRDRKRNVLRIQPKVALIAGDSLLLRRARSFCNKQLLPPLIVSLIHAICP